MPKVKVDLNRIEELERKIIDRIYEETNLDEVKIDLSKFELIVDYTVDVDVQINSIVLNYKI